MLTGGARWRRASSVDVGRCHITWGDAENRDAATQPAHVRDERLPGPVDTCVRAAGCCKCRHELRLR